MVEALGLCDGSRLICRRNEDVWRVCWIQKEAEDDPAGAFPDAVWALPMLPEQKKAVLTGTVVIVEPDPGASNNAAAQGVEKNARLRGFYGGSIARCERGCETLSVC